LLFTDLITIPLATLVLATSGGGHCLAPKSQLFFKPTVSAVKWNISESAGTLTGAHGGGGSGLVLGLAAAPLYYEYMNEYRVYELENGKVCLSLDNTKMYFRARPIVFISKEFPRGTCEFNAVLRHEKKHVAALRRFHKKYTSRFREKVRNTQELTRSVSIDKSQINAYRKKMDESFEKEIAAYLEEVTALLAREQTKIDSPTEYARVDAECDGWNRRLRLE
jgi:hypothetical protein